MKTKTTAVAQPANKGWQVTIAGTSALLALGVLYAWSVIKANIPAEWGWTNAEKIMPYSVACVVFSLMTLVGAWLLRRKQYQARVLYCGSSMKMTAPKQRLPERIVTIA